MPDCAYENIEKYKKNGFKNFKSEIWSWQKITSGVVHQVNTHSNYVQ